MRGVTSAVNMNDFAHWRRESKSPPELARGRSFSARGYCQVFRSLTLCGPDLKLKGSPPIFFVAVEFLAVVFVGFDRPPCGRAS
jgi:hypothetical protein